MAEELLYNPLLKKNFQYHYDSTDVEALLDQTINITIYETLTITASNTGAVTAIADTTIDPNHFGAIGAVIVSETSGGFPTNVTPTEANGDPVTATITVGGTVTFSAVITGQYAVYYGLDVSYRDYINLSSGVKNRIVDDALNVERGIEGLTVDDDGNIVIENGIIINGQIVYAEPITPPVITVNQNNYSPTGLDTTSRIDATSTNNVKITGLDATSFIDGRIVRFRNNNASGGFNITLVANSGSSLAANRFDFTTNQVLRPGEWIDIMYGGVSLRFYRSA